MARLAAAFYKGFLDYVIYLVSRAIMAAITIINPEPRQPLVPTLARCKERVYERVKWI